MLLTKRYEEASSDSGSCSLSSTSIYLNSPTSMPSAKVKSNMMMIWCYALVFKLGIKKERKRSILTALELLQQLKQKAKVDVKVFKSTEMVQDEDGLEHPKYLIALLGLSERELLHWASLRSITMKLDPRRAVIAGRKMKFPLAEQTRLNSEKKTQIRNLETWENIWCDYTRDADHRIFSHYPVDPGSEPFAECAPSDESSPFSQTERLRMIYEKIVTPTGLFGGGIPILKLESFDDHSLYKIFPLHNSKCQEWLRENWLHRYNPWDLLVIPVDNIRDYLGTPIGYYFAFIQFYIWYLLPLSVAGAIFGWFHLFQGRTGEQVFPTGLGETAALTIICWSVVFVDMWKRKQADLRVRWGMTKAESSAVMRERFVGTWTVDEITGELTKDQPRSVYIFRTCLGISGLFTFMSIVCVTYGFLFWVRHIQIKQGVKVCVDGSTEEDGVCYEYRCLSSEDGPECANEDDYVKKLTLNWQVLLAVFNGLQILIYDTIFTRISSYITDWENHRTQARYDNFVILKLFAFKFVNAFISLFYLAYFQADVERVEYTNSEIIDALGVQLIVMFTSSLTFQNINELRESFTSRLRKKCCKEKKREMSELSPAEIECNLMEYKGTMYDTCEIIIHFGYVTLFVVAFPFVPIVALISAVVEARLDGYKILTMCHRPIPYCSPGLGTWVQVLDFISIISVLNNVLLIVFLTDWPSKMLHQEPSEISTQEKQLLFFTVAGVLCVVVLLIKMCIPNESWKVQRHIKRQNYIEGVLCRRQNINRDKFCDNSELLRVASHEEDMKTWWGRMFTKKSMSILEHTKFLGIGSGYWTDLVESTCDLEKKVSALERWDTFGKKFTLAEQLNSYCVRSKELDEGGYIIDIDEQINWQRKTEMPIVTRKGSTTPPSYSSSESVHVPGEKRTMLKRYAF